MKFWLLLFLPICLISFANEACAQISVNFQARASVTGAKIVLADIAVIKPSGGEADAIGQLPVTASPAPGASKELYTVAVITSLRNRPETANVDWQGSETIIVQRKGNRVGQQQLQKIIDDYLKANSTKLPKAEIRFALLHSPDELTLPYGELAWKVTPARPEIMGSSSFSILFSIDGKPAGNCIVRGKLEAITEVATATATLHKGDLITADKITMEKQNIDKLNNPILAKEEIVGKQVARTVNAGKPVEKEQIVLPPIIKEGDMVKISARKGTLQITTSGIAKADGRQGETIRVKNVNSNKLIYCRVDGAGIVSVEF